MYFFIFKSNGFVKHVIKAGTREDANIQLKALTDENPPWDHIGASVSVVHCEYNTQQSVNTDKPLVVRNSAGVVFCATCGTGLDVA